jgi:serine/threonine protein kinase
MSAAPDERGPGGELLPGYQVVGRLQRGRDFETYDVWSRQRYSRCVVKVIRADRTGSLSLRGRLLLEGHLLRAFDHPHLVRAYDVVTGQTPGVVLETLTGATLSHLLDRGRNKLTADGIAHLGCQVASALQFMHDNGYLHLDVKPGNIIVQGGTAKVIDLSLTQPPGRVAAGLGTTAYLAPEQATGGVATQASDVWGLAVTLYEAATGVSPFDPPTSGHSGSGAADPAPGAGRSAATDPSGQGDAGQDDAGQGDAGQDDAGQDDAGQDDAGQDDAGQSDAGQSSAGQRCPDCGERVHRYLQTEGRASRVRRWRRLPRPMAEVIDAGMEPVAADRPALAELHNALRGYADSDDPNW